MSFSNSEKKKISIICPVFNEEKIISLYYERFQKAISCLQDRYLIELIFVNNCSEDNTLTTAKNLHSQDPSVQIISLTRNFGYQSSVLCGLTFATGDAIVVNDVDGEDPPELIPKFVEQWEKGYEIIWIGTEKGIENKVVNSDSIITILHLSIDTLFKLKYLKSKSSILCQDQI